MDTVTSIRSTGKRHTWYPERETPDWTAQNGSEKKKKRKKKNERKEKKKESCHFNFGARRRGGGPNGGVMCCTKWKGGEGKGSNRETQDRGRTRKPRGQNLTNDVPLQERGIATVEPNTKKKSEKKKRDERAPEKHAEPGKDNLGS